MNNSRRIALDGIGTDSRNVALQGMFFVKITIVEIANRVRRHTAKLPKHLWAFTPYAKR